MAKVKEYSAIEALRDGCRVEIRALRPDDRADLIAAAKKTARIVSTIGDLLGQRQREAIGPRLEQFSHQFGNE